MLVYHWYGCRLACSRSDLQAAGWGGSDVAAVAALESMPLSGPLAVDRRAHQSTSSRSRDSRPLGPQRGNTCPPHFLSAASVPVAPLLTTYSLHPMYHQPWGGAAPQQQPTEAGAAQQQQQQPWGAQPQNTAAAGVLAGQQQQAWSAAAAAAAGAPAGGAAAYQQYYQQAAAAAPAGQPQQGPGGVAAAATYYPAAAAPAAPAGLRQWVGTVTQIIPPNYGVVDGDAYYINAVVVGQIPQVRARLRRAGGWLGGSTVVTRRHR